VGVDVRELAGNMDGSVDAGEEGWIEVTVRNLLDYEARSVMGTVTCNDRAVTITDGLAWWGDILPNATKSSRPNGVGIRLSQENSSPLVVLDLALKWMDRAVAGITRAAESRSP